MEPTFKNLPEMKVVGLGAHFISILSPQKNNSIVIPQLWHDFMQRFDEIPDKTGGASMGLVEMPPKSANAKPGELFYVAATEVSTFDSAPKDMLQRTIPAGRYALFTHKGKLDRLGKTMQHIYTVWLPQSKIQLRGAPHLELYDQRFNPNSDESEFDILLPVQ